MKNKIMWLVGAVALFLVLAYGFVPQVLSGKIVNQSDISGYIGMSHEMTQWNKAHPNDPTAWTDAMFGGMPTTSISAPRQGDWTQQIYDFLLTGKRPATYLFISLLGSFLLMLSLGIEGILAIGGAVAVTFCSYNIQIIQVGHNTKMQAIAFLPWVLAALIYTYRAALKEKSQARRGWLWNALLGAALFGFALSFQIKANHQQITYYLALMILLLAVVLLVWILSNSERRRQLTGRFFAASALLLVVGCIGIGTNTIKLAPLYDYTQYTMRGGSELGGTENAKAENAGAESAKAKGGLDLEYATAWSYGWEELPNLMIPNFNGGSSAGAVNPAKSETYALLKQAGQPNLTEISKHLPLYWGPQPFTAGPMYMGAISVFLFLLGLLLYEGKEKWWLLAVTVLAVLLALGNHLMGFTRLMFQYAPMYNKFRTVSMALILLQFTLPMLGFLVLDRILKNTYDRKVVFRKTLWAFAITGGFCLLCWLMPDLAGNFSAASDAGQPQVLADALAADRRMLLRTDALTSLLLIGAATVLILWTITESGKGRSRSGIAAAGICALILLNLFVVGKRYLKADDFTTPRDFTRQFTARTVDKMILEDPEPSYRVLDLTVDVFNDSHPSYHHKNIGGYSPAKLQRYQDLIDRYLVKEINGLYKSMEGVQTIGELEERLPDLPVLSMLNLKYLILGAENPPAQYPYANGPAWYVDSLVTVASPDAEIAALGRYDLRTTAILGPDFAAAADGATAGMPGTDDTLEMLSYAPNELHYRYRAANDRMAVFSEVWYPGWKLSVIPEVKGAQQQELPLLRANWILRAAQLPAGEGELVLRFEPEVYTVSKNISRASSILLILLTLLAAGGSIRYTKKEVDE